MAALVYLASLAVKTTTATQDPNHPKPYPGAPFEQDISKINQACGSSTPDRYAQCKSKEEYCNALIELPDIGADPQNCANFPSSTTQTERGKPYPGAHTEAEEHVKLDLVCPDTTTHQCRDMNEYCQRLLDNPAWGRDPQNCVNFQSSNTQWHYGEPYPGDYTPDYPPYPGGFAAYAVNIKKACPRGDPPQCANQEEYCTKATRLGIIDTPNCAGYL